MRMQGENPYAVAQAWLDAVNHQDIERLIELSDPNIELSGPRGAAQGSHQALRDWMGRAGLRLTTQRVFARGDAVVVAQHGVWRAAETGEITGERDLASSFRIRGRHVTSYARYDSLDVALREAGLGHADQRQQEAAPDA